MKHKKDHTPHSSIDAVLAYLQSESPTAMMERERTAFDRHSNPFSDSIVLFGAGTLGRSTLKGLRKIGLEPLAFTDNNRALWGNRVDDLEVIPPHDAVARYGDRAAFVVTIYNGTPVREQLHKLSCQRIVPFPLLMWKYPAVFIPASGLELPHRILEQEDDIRKGYSLLADEVSQREFCEQLRWRVLLDYDCLSDPLDGRQTYFPSDLVVPSEREVFVDCGAFDGDSIRSFMFHRNNLFDHIYALEPEPANRLALQQFVANLPSSLSGKVTILPYAVGSHNGRVAFNMGNSSASKIASEAGTGEVDCRRLDGLFSDRRPTYIKMDTEGAEPEAIQGAGNLLSESRSVVAACVYHRCEHLWQIPMMIHSLSPQHQIFLRRYAEECWETVCYAVPPERLVSRMPEPTTEMR